jgi:hypothetical protein
MTFCVIYITHKFQYNNIIQWKERKKENCRKMEKTVIPFSIEMTFQYHNLLQKKNNETLGSNFYSNVRKKNESPLPTRVSMLEQHEERKKKYFQ